MVVTPQSSFATGRTQDTLERSHDSLDDAEKGMYENMGELSPLPFAYLKEKETTVHIENIQLSGMSSPVHNGITPFASTPELSLPFPQGRRASQPVNAKELKAAVKKVVPVKPKISRWVLFDLWFNTYRKLFTLVVSLNLVGIIMAALGRFTYAEDHLGALVLGNLLSAVLFRNELWMRFLYLVCIYGLRSVCESDQAPISRLTNYHSGRQTESNWPRLRSCNM
jgi:hypothetical protein